MQSNICNKIFLYLMQLSFTQKKHIRKNFGKLVEGLSIPNLIEVQKNSYNEFLESKSLNEQLYFDESFLYKYILSSIPSISLLLNTFSR